MIKSTTALWITLMTLAAGCGSGSDTSFQQGDFVNAYRKTQETTGESDNPLDQMMKRTYMNYLKTKTYGSEGITIKNNVFKDGAITVNSVVYESEGYMITGLLAEPLAAQKYPGIVICHGYYPVEGYFQGQGTLETMKVMAREGYAVLMTDYRGYYKSEGKNKVDYLGEFVDCMNAIQALRKYPNVNPDNTAVVGYSWGGGFALRCLLLDQKLKCGALYYPEIGGIDKPKRSTYAYLKNMKATDEMIDDYFKKWSPLYYTAWATAPTIIFQGGLDRTVVPEQSATLERMLKANNKEVTLVMFDQLTHAFADSPQNPSMKQLFEFFGKYLKQP